jgi:hypothetical protein
MQVQPTAGQPSQTTSELPVADQPSNQPAKQPTNQNQSKATKSNQTELPSPQIDIGLERVSLIQEIGRQHAKRNADGELADLAGIKNSKRY